MSQNNGIPIKYILYCTLEVFLGIDVELLFTENTFVQGATYIHTYVRTCVHTYVQYTSRWD